MINLESLEVTLCNITKNSTNNDQTSCGKKEKGFKRKDTKLTMILKPEHFYYMYVTNLCLSELDLIKSAFFY